MKTLNQSDAPAGFKAVPMTNPYRPCLGCDFKRDGGCIKSAPQSCMPYLRDDGKAVIFVKA